MKNINIGLSALVIGATVIGSTSAFAAEESSNEIRPEISDEVRVKLAEMKSLFESGAVNEAKDIRKSLKEDYGFGGFRRGKGKRGGQLSAVKEAIDASDYAAWSEVLGESKWFPSEAVNEEVFAKMVEAHELRESGDYEAAKGIMDGVAEEYGIGKREGRGRKMRNGFGR